MSDTKHILLALLEDKPGVLNRMASVFRRRGYNRERERYWPISVVVVPSLTRVTIVVAAPGR
jgi:acetolactate synthase-1/3 small subunit